MSKNYRMFTAAGPTNEWPVPMQQRRHWTVTSVLQEVGLAPVCRLPQAQAEGTK